MNIICMKTQRKNLKCLLVNERNLSEKGYLLHDLNYRTMSKGKYGVKDQWLPWFWERNEGGAMQDFYGS